MGAGSSNSIKSIKLEQDKNIDRQVFLGLGKFSNLSLND